MSDPTKPLICAACTPLPVELTNFQASTDGSTATLTWQTATETNNAGFDIEHLLGETWHRLGFVAGYGTTRETQTYTFQTAPLEPGRHSFRLKQIDYDGTFAYSKTLSVTIEVPGTHILTSAYPNPFNPSTQLSLSVAHDQHVRIEVFDALGRSVHLLHDGMLTGTVQHVFRFDADGLPGGLYIIRATGDTFMDHSNVMYLK